MKNVTTECLYCGQNGARENLMIEIAQLSVSTVYLFKEQTYMGRCIVAYKEHVKDLHELSVEDRNAFMDDVCRVGKALEKVFNAQSINYGIFNDLIAHLHVHLVPKYQGGSNWGGTFDMAPKRTFLSPAGYERVIGEIRAELLNNK